MKEQYIGDINDYRKYTLLRALSRESGLRIGVCWMMTPNDERTDGNKRYYLSRSSLWRHHDPELYDGLSGLFTANSSPSISQIEAMSCLQGLDYFNSIIPDILTERQSYMEKAAIALSKSGVIFFDPDNGLNVASIKKGNKNSSKYVYRDEVSEFYNSGKSVLVYQHYPRIHRDTFERDLSTELRTLCPSSKIHIFATSNVAFIFIVRPDHPTLNDKAVRIGQNNTREMFTYKSSH